MKDKIIAIGLLVASAGIGLLVIIWGEVLATKEDWKITDVIQTVKIDMSIYELRTHYHKTSIPIRALLIDKQKECIEYDSTGFCSEEQWYYDYIYRDWYPFPSSFDTTVYLPTKVNYPWYPLEKEDIRIDNMKITHEITATRNGRFKTVVRRFKRGDPMPLRGSQIKLKLRWGKIIDN